MKGKHYHLHPIYVVPFRPSHNTLNTFIFSFSICSVCFYFRRLFLMLALFTHGNIAWNVRNEPLQHTFILVAFLKCTVSYKCVDNPQISRVSNMACCKWLAVAKECFAFTGLLLQNAAEAEKVARQNIAAVIWLASFTLKVTVHLHGCLQSNGCSASRLHHRLADTLNPLYQIKAYRSGCSKM